MERRKARTRTVAMVVLCGILAYALIATGGSLEPSAPPGPTMKTLAEVEPRIPISSLPYTISTSGSYYLTGDLTSTTAGITVDADNVTIDLMGYSLAGQGSLPAHCGVLLNGASNVEIRNGTVRGFGLGIYEGSSAGKGHRVISVRAISNSSAGIELLSSGNLVKNCTAAGNGANGIYVGARSTVTGNNVCDNQNLGIATAAGCTITGNTANSSQTHGIFADAGSTVSGNTACDNEQNGIWTFAGCTVTNNTAYYNKEDGIRASNGSTLTGNSAYNNEEAGIFTGYHCTVTGNTAYYNKDDGIALHANCLVDQNTAYGNNQSGGSYVNMDLTLTDCTYGVNHAP